MREVGGQRPVRLPGRPPPDHDAPDPGAPDRPEEFPMTESTMTATRPATLAMAGISKHFAGVAALTDVSVEVLAGEGHAMLRETGAGKSPLMNIATGVLQPDTGTITVAGQDVYGLTPREATSLGIAIVHQHPAVLPDMTVLENLEVALPAEVFADGSPTEVAARLLGHVGLRVDPRDRVEDLSVAQRHLVEIAKAFAVSPK